MKLIRSVRAWSRPAALAAAFLAIEFLDELVYGAQEAAWPLIRDDLGLSYVQIGMLLSLPGLVSSFIEPSLGILGDIWRRRLLILGGGALFAASLVLTAASQSFLPLLFSFVLFFPASGAFVGLSQASLMDQDPERHEQNMARWSSAGSIGVVSGPLALGGAVLVGLNWRGLYLVFAALSLATALALRCVYPRTGSEADRTGGTATQFWRGWGEALVALRRPGILRWLALLEMSDLMLDILLGYLALYFVDVVGATPVQAGMAVAVWTGLGLLGDLLLIPLLERVRGLSYLRLSAAVELALFVCFVLVRGYEPKLLFVGLLGLLNAGWYSILKAQLYSSLPGRSGLVMTVNNLFGLVASLIPLGLGLVAERHGLKVSMWLLALGPVALLIGIPRHQPARR